MITQISKHVIVEPKIPIWWMTDQYKYDSKGNLLKVIPNNPIEWYLDRFVNNRYYTEVCFGDGEFRLMMDERGLVNIRGGEICPEIWEAWLLSVRHVKENKGDFFMRTLAKKYAFPYMFEYKDNTVHPQGAFMIIEAFGLRDYHWHGAFIWKEAIQNGLFGPILGEIMKRDVVIAAPVENQKCKEKGLNYVKWIPTEITTEYGRDQWKYVLDECLSYGKPAVYLIGCGEGSAVVCAHLHTKVKDSFIIDLGKGLDYLTGFRFWGTDKPNARDPIEKEKQRQKYYLTVESNWAKAKEWKTKH